MVGFDLVGQEDKGKPLTEWSPLLADAAAPLFLHAGETAVVGGAADMNLVDALLLRTSRIGHGYALAHHAVLRAEIKRSGSRPRVPASAACRFLHRQCSNLLYKVHRSHRCKVRRNHRNGAPWHPLHRRQQGNPMYSYENRSQIRALRVHVAVFAPTALMGRCTARRRRRGLPAVEPSADARGRPPQPPGLLTQGVLGSHRTLGTSSRTPWALSR